MNHFPHLRLHSCCSQVIKDVSLGSQSVSRVMHASFHYHCRTDHICPSRIYCTLAKSTYDLNDAPILLITHNQNTLKSGIAMPGILLTSAKLVGLNSHRLTYWPYLFQTTPQRKHRDISYIHGKHRGTLDKSPREWTFSAPCPVWIFFNLENGG